LLKHNPLTPSPSPTRGEGSKKEAVSHQGRGEQEGSGLPPGERGARRKRYGSNIPGVLWKLLYGIVPLLP